MAEIFNSKDPTLGKPINIEIVSLKTKLIRVLKNEGIITQPVSQLRFLKAQRSQTGFEWVLSLLELTFRSILIYRSNHGSSHMNHLTVNFHCIM